MSQEKVDKYKKEKANRKKIMAREKRMKRIYILLGTLVGIAFVAWIGFSVYNDFIKEEPPAATLSAEEIAELQSLLAEQAAASETSSSEGDETTSGEEDESNTSEEETSAEATSSEE